LIARVHVVEGRLRRTSRDGVVGEALAVAEDYGDLAEGLLALHQATGDPRWLAEAGELLSFAIEHFSGDNGAFYDTADDAEELVRRPQDVSDNAHPSGTTALVNALVTYGALTGSTAHHDIARLALAANSGFGIQHPRYFGWGLTAAEAFLGGPLQVAIAQNAEASRWDSGVRTEHGDDLVRTAWRRRPPGAVIVSGAPDAPGVPLLADRPLVDGKPTAYVCRGFVCDLPVTTTDDLLARL